MFSKHEVVHLFINAKMFRTLGLCMCMCNNVYGGELTCTVSKCDLHGY